MKKLILSLALAALVVAALPATASTFVAMDRAEMARTSDAVVVGEVTAVHSSWNEDATAIITEAFVKVDETIAGQAPGVVIVRTFGGQVGAVMIEAHGFPKFAEGQRVVLFLEGADNVARVVGYQQGQYRVIRRHSDGVEVAVPTVDHGANLLHRDGTPAAAPRALTMNALRDEVRDVAADIRTGGATAKRIR